MEGGSGRRGMRRGERDGETEEGVQRYALDRIGRNTRGSGANDEGVGLGEASCEGGTPYVRRK